jgi:hypothetical protein
MTIPIYDENAPIACTASASELETRVEQLEALRAAMRSVERTDDGLLVGFDASQDAAELRQFTRDEKACCNFWGFEIHQRDGAPLLRWDGPPAVADFLDRLYGWFVSDEPLTPGSGLL